MIREFPAERMILWVGAGVSYPGPSSLPLGIPLTKFALDECCGAEITTRIFGLWDKVNSLVGTPDNPAPLGVAPRLESVLGDIDDVRAHSAGRGFDFLSGFRAFTAAPFNQNHVHIAELVRRGAAVVTTNFDTCIEDAYRRLTGAADEMVLSREYVTPCYIPRGGGAAGKVWHVHGAAGDVSSLGATVRAVKEGLREDFRNWLDGALARGSLLIFLGYGAGDSFDVNLYFADKAESAFSRSAGWFVQHPGAPAPRGAALLVAPCGRNLITTEDTTELFRSLSGGDTRIEPAAPFPWKDEFLRRAVTAERGNVAGYLTCKLAFTLGINVDFLAGNAYADALRAEGNFRAKEFHTTLAYVCRVRGQGRLEKRHDLKSMRGGEGLLGYYYSKGRARRALKYSKSVDELFEDVRRGGEMNWDTYTSMSAHCRAALMKYLVNPLAHRVGRRDRLRMERLMALTELLNQVPLRNVRFVNQVATALRFNFIFKALLRGGEDRQAIERVLSLYGEGASVAGFISTHRDVAIMYFLLDKFHGAERLREADAHIDKSLKLAEAVGDLPSVKRAERLRVYFRINSYFRNVLRARTA